MKLKEILIENEIEDILKKSVETFADELEDTEVQQEGVGLAIAGGALAIPEIISIIGKLTNKVGNLLKTNKISGDKLIEVADKLHHFLVHIIEGALKKLGVKNNVHQIANVLLHVIVAGLMFASGFATVKALKTAKFSVATLEGALTAVKNKELSKFLAKQLSNFK